MTKLFARVIFFLSVFVAVSGFAQHDIKVKVRGIKDIKCTLSHYFGYDQQVPKDSAQADAEGNLHFVGKEKLPEGLYLVLIPKHGYFELVMGEDQAFSVETDTLNYLKHMKVQDSRENELYYEFQQFYAQKVDAIRKIQGEDQPKPKKTDAKQPEKQEKKKLTPEEEKQINALGKEIETFAKKFLNDNKETLTVKFIKAPMDPEIPDSFRASLVGKKDSSERIFYYYKQHYFDNIDLSDERMFKTPFLQRKLERYLNDLTVQVTDSVCKAADHIVSLTKNNETMKKYVIWYITNTYENPKTLGTDGVIVCMGEKYYIGQPTLWDTATISRFKERLKIIKPLVIGNVIPDMYPSDSLGRFVSLHSIKSKYTLVFLYDPNCGHCKETTPKLVKLYDEKLKNKGLTVYFVSIERNIKDWKKFIKDYKTEKFINLIDVHINPNTKKEEYYVDFRNTYDVYATPVSYVLDKDKKIIAKRMPVEQLEDFINFYDKYLEQQAKNKENGTSNAK